MQVRVNRTRAGLAAVLALCGAGAALAQGPQGPPPGPPDPERMAERQVSMMKDRLKLTADQEKKVKPILVDSAKKMMEMREKFGPPEPGQPPPEEAMAAMKKAREETNKKLAEVLTKEQMEQYEKMRPGPGGPRGPGGPGGPGGPQGRRPPEQ